MQPVGSQHAWVRETRFGRWFLSTDIWRRYVLGEAILDLDQMLGSDRRAVGRMLDAGCGMGLAFLLLEQTFQPQSIVGVDIDKALTEIAKKSARHCQCQVDVDTVSLPELSLPNQFFDMIFCHQLLHHTVDQEGVLKAFYRLLVPGGVVLIGESCRPFIRSLPVRLLFRHPMMVQKSAAEYVDLVKSIGFEVGESDVKTSTPWWSRRDLGLLERLGIAKKKSVPVAEVLMVARKPTTNHRA